MVMPGWNVTEPISAAAKFYQFVQKYRDASQEIQEFASKVDAFRQVLEVFDCCLKYPESVDVEMRQWLRSVPESCRQCAENCKTFVDRFFNRYENATLTEIGAANKLLWVWNKEKAINLGAKIQEQLNLINVHVNLAEWRSRQQQQLRQQQQQASSSHETPRTPIPITPATLLKGLPPITPPSSPALIQGFPPLDPSPHNSKAYLHSQPYPHRALLVDENFGGAFKSNFSPVADPFIDAQLNRRFSLPVNVPQKLSQGSYRWCPEMTMANLVGASLHRKNGSRTPLPVSRIEFLRDFHDNVSHIVSSHANAKFFQKLSRSPPSIPHTEHPIAYKGERLLMVKFLEPHGFTLHMGPASVSVPASRNQPAPTPIALGSPAMQAIPSTFASSSIFRGALTVGSPSLPIGGSRIRRDTPYPMYEFKLEKDYKKFQGHIMGKTLLVNAPIEKIESKPVNSSRSRQESEKQYLRLWAHQGAQTIMYNANSQLSSPVYVEHDVESFHHNEVNASPTRLILDIKRTEPKQLSEALRTLDHLVIVFSDAEGVPRTKDKKIFLAEARFHGTPNPAMIPPLGL